MRSDSFVAASLRQLLGRGRADPRGAQLFFLLPVYLDLVQRLLFMGVDGFVPSYLAGLGVILSATALAILAGQGTLGAGRPVVVAAMAVPVLDLLGLGVIRLDPPTGIGIAVVLPALWLGLQFGQRGVLITAVALLACVVLPAPLLADSALSSISRALQLWVVGLLASATVAVTAELWAAQAEELQFNVRGLGQAVREVDAHRRRTEAILRSVDVGLVGLDSNGRYQSMNPRHAEFMRLAYPDGHDGLAGQEGAVYSPDGITLMTSEQMPTTRAMRGEAFSGYLLWIGRSRETRRIVSVSGTPLLDAAGNFDGAVLAYHDVTDLTEAARIKDEFVATVSHELRTPLTSIIGYVDLVLDDASLLSPVLTRHLEVAQRNARRLHRLVDDLLSTALQSVSSVIAIEPLRLVEILTPSAREAEKAAGRAGQSFEYLVDANADDPPVVVHGDAERLSQVFDNLFSNAVKYTGHDGHIACTLHREGTDAVVRVRDTGHGIPAHELDGVFEKFFRSAEVSGRAIPGVGLGLAIVKTIVEAHGGTISVSSTPGEGSVFEVRLPTVTTPRLTR